MVGINNGSSGDKGFHWANQSKLMIHQLENIIKELVPCPMDRVIAESRYRTGLSEKKVSEIINIFIAREVVKFEVVDYRGEKVKCMVISNA